MLENVTLGLQPSEYTVPNREDVKSSTKADAGKGGSEATPARQFELQPMRPTVIAAQAEQRQW